MNEPVAKTYEDLVLPLSIISKVDVSRLVNEVERIDNELIEASVRVKSGVDAQAQPVLSDQLTDFLNQNKTTLNDSRERAALIKQLRTLKDRLPVIHMTFASVADGESLQQLTQWLRASVHSQAVIASGIQPALVAGVYIRTPSHVYDFSLRTKLKGQRGALVKELEQLRG